ncbi:MAG: CDF family Co(II)/Ni(II) efflux transporter DmeF [Deltaproteobacteria bacterium]|nr:CDF family Co(II)/Ni(II) efflux transporter DmeF [Deltaproteobacteria bacterium]MBW2171727.1 CDF family Co(II)/Ni(II) efflux transporter DmeF [Deltaproteobacteria bacterium]
MDDLSPWCHEHVFLGANQQINERRTWIVIGLTASMMIVEIVCGLLFGSMALLADGWHMASHAAALGITALAYLFARRHASDPRYSFGTGKMGELAGYSSALLLAVIAVIMAYESVNRLISPVPISFDQAIAVAVLGLVVNVISALLLKGKHREEHHHSSDHADHNIRAAYLHVLADALTSLLAIVALSSGRFLGWVWMDPFMGIVGAVIIARWSYNLMRDTGRILLDMNTRRSLPDDVRRLIESDADNQIADLHVWRVGPGYFAVIVSVITEQPRPPDHYKDLLRTLKQICHITVEVNPRKV